METFFSTIFIFLLILSITIHLRLLGRQKLIQIQYEKTEVENLDNMNIIIENLGEIDDKIVHIDRSLQELKEQLEAKPMKSNNWDSVRDVFSKSSRNVELNE